jgi:hypothetical protein
VLLKPNEKLSLRTGISNIFANAADKDVRRRGKLTVATIPLTRLPTAPQAVAYTKENATQNSPNTFTLLDKDDPKRSMAFNTIVTLMVMSPPKKSVGGPNVNLPSI